MKQPELTAGRSALVPTGLALQTHGAQCWAERWGPQAHIVPKDLTVQRGTHISVREPCMGSGSVCRRRGVPGLGVQWGWVTVAGSGGKVVPGAGGAGVMEGSGPGVSAGSGGTSEFWEGGYRSKGVR